MRLHGGVALAVDIARVRRFEFDIEKMRPATLVIVTESASDPPQVLDGDPADYGEVADALVTIGLRLAQASSFAVKTTGQAETLAGWRAIQVRGSPSRE